MNKLNRFISLMREIVELINIESEAVKSGYSTMWDSNQLDIISVEINQLLSFALKGQIYFQFGKNQRMLESTYIITDSLLPLNRTSLGQKIVELQHIYNSF